MDLYSLSESVGVKIPMIGLVHMRFLQNLVRLLKKSKIWNKLLWIEGIYRVKQIITYLTPVKNAVFVRLYGDVAY